MNHETGRIDRRTPSHSTRGSLILKLALGEDPHSIPSALDIRMGRENFRVTTGIHAVDRVLRHFSSEQQIFRVHSSAASLRGATAGHQGFDEVEHAIGLSRTFEVDLDDDCPIADTIDALQQIVFVEQAYPHYLSITPFATPTMAMHVDREEAWRSRNMIRAAEALAYEPGDGAVIVAIVDTGVMLEHPELEVKMRRGYDTVQLIATDLPAGAHLLQDESRGYGEPEDMVGHGTSCAGIIGAVGDEIPPGLAGNCGVLPIRVLGSAQYPGRSEPVGIGAIADIDCGVKYAIDLGAKVLNFSFGTPSSDMDTNAAMPHQDVVQYGLARGCIMVAASGNSGREETFSPAALDGVIAVGSVDANGSPSEFSTRGAHVALSAPGEGIISSSLHGYSRVSGTSFAAPSVSAAVALLVSRALRRAQSFDVSDARRILCASARPWQSGRGKGGGAGVLDVAAALAFLDGEIDTNLDLAAASGRHGRSASLKGAIA